MALPSHQIMDPVLARREREDMLHKGGVRVARLFGLPAVLAILLIAVAYFVQILITGWQGVLWALAIAGPLWATAIIACANDPYGVNVLAAWFKCCIWMKDEGFGGDTFTPLPRASSSKIRGIYHVAD